MSLPLSYRPRGRGLQSVDTCIRPDAHDWNPSLALAFANGELQTVTATQGSVTLVQSFTWTVDGCLETVSPWTEVQDVPEPTQTVHEITTPKLIGFTLALLSACAAVATASADIHSRFVLPAILHEATKVMEAALDRHERRPHDGAITQGQWSVVMEQLRRIEKRIDDLK